MKKRDLILIGLSILLVLYFFAYPMTIFWDSGHYATYLPILKGNVAWNQWDMVRGIVFPGLIYLSQLLFGETGSGILTLSFIFYIIMLASVYLLLKDVFKYEKEKIKNRCILFSLLFLIIDPLIFGYFHSLLTEFVAISISCLMIYLSWKWMDIDFKQCKFKYIIFTCIFIVGTIFSWHLKQPYVTVTLFPVIIASILSIINEHKLSNIIQRLSTVLLCIICLVCSIKIWNSFLSHGGVDTSNTNNRNVVASLGNQILNGLYNYDSKPLSRTSTTSFLSDKELEKVKSDPNNYFIMSIKDLDGKIIDQELFYAKNLKASTFDSFKYISLQMFKHPILVLDSYVTTYLAISNFYTKTSYDGGATYDVEKNFSLKYCHENCVIGHSYLNRASNIYYMPDYYYSNVSNYSQYKATPMVLTFILKLFSYPNRFIYKFLMLLLPILLISITISYFKNKKDRNILTPIMIMSWYSFLHVMVHVVTYAYIDRYASPIYISSILSLFIYLYYLCVKYFNKKHSK